MKLKTRSGLPLHPIGVGTWGIGGTWEADFTNDLVGINAIRYSISKGQNHIDCGQVYGAGHTDEVVGRAIAGQKREDLFLTDKLWETSVGRGKVDQAVKSMLKKLGTDYLDILYIHKPWVDWPWQEAIPQINELIEGGIVRYFGVSNFNVSQMKRTLQLSNQPIVVNQLHYNVVYKKEVSRDVKSFCKVHNIQLVAWKPLERGEVANNKTVREIAKAYRATPEQIALAWLVSKNVLSVPQAVQKRYIDLNVASLEIKLARGDIKRLDNL